MLELRFYVEHRGTAPRIISMVRVTVVTVRTLWDNMKLNRLEAHWPQAGPGHRGKAALALAT
jgi:hypothetical protein